MFALSPRTILEVSLTSRLLMKAADCRRQAEKFVLLETSTSTTLETIQLHRQERALIRKHESRLAATAASYIYCLLTTSVKQKKNLIRSCFRCICFSIRFCLCKIRSSERYRLSSVSLSLLLRRITFRFD